MSENTFWLSIWITIIFVVGFLCGDGMRRSYNENLVYIQHGYTKKLYPGIEGSIWVKDIEK